MKKMSNFWNIMFYSNMINTTNAFPDVQMKKINQWISIKFALNQNHIAKYRAQYMYLIRNQADQNTKQFTCWSGNENKHCSLL